MIFNQTDTHPSWIRILEHSLSKVDKKYLKSLTHNTHWLPGPYKIFNAFRQPLSEVKFILMGESPYPRPESANGYAFWDGRVKEIWSQVGFSPLVNRATSLRNLLKMLLVAEKKLTGKTTDQEAISQINRKYLVSSLDELFHNFLKKGFLLLNASLVLSERPVQEDAKAWQPFIKAVLEAVHEQNPKVQLILFGAIANKLSKFGLPFSNSLISEHPYNQTFITNPEVIRFFAPLKLMTKPNIF